LLSLSTNPNVEVDVFLFLLPSFLLPLLNQYTYDCIRIIYWCNIIICDFLSITDSLKPTFPQIIPTINSFSSPRFDSTIYRLLPLLLSFFLNFQLLVSFRYFSVYGTVRQVKLIYNFIYFEHTRNILMLYRIISYVCCTSTELW